MIEVGVAHPIETSTVDPGPAGLAWSMIQL
jgi:hypothetical protein